MVQNYFWSLLNHISSLPLLNKTQKQNDCSSYLLLDICDALHNFVPFVQLKKCEKHPWRILGAAGQDLHFYKKDSIPGIFLWVLRNYQKHPFYKTPQDHSSDNDNQENEKHLQFFLLSLLSLLHLHCLYHFCETVDEQNFLMHTRKFISGGNTTESL